MWERSAHTAKGGFMRVWLLLVGRFDCANWMIVSIGRLTVELTKDYGSIVTRILVALVQYKLLTMFGCQNEFEQPSRTIAPKRFLSNVNVTADSDQICPLQIVCTIKITPF